MTLPIGGGIGVATLTDGDAFSPHDYFADVLSDAMQSAWTTNRPQVETLLRDQLGAADLIRTGFTLYDIDVRISHDLSYSIDRDDNGDVVISVSTGGNYIEATSTQPTAAGKWADPRFSIAFGLSFSYVLDIPPVTAPISATGVSRARILTPVVDSHGIIADIAFIVNDVYAWFSGTDYVAKIEGIIAGMDFASVINAALGPVNATLTALAADGYWYLDAVVDALDGTSGTIHALAIPGAPADQLELLLTVRAFDRSGAIEGELHWPVGLGMPRHPGLVRDTVADLSAVASSVLVRELPGQWASSVPVPAEAPASAEAPAQPTVFAAPVFAGATVSAATQSLSGALGALAPDDRVTALTQLRQGKASRFVSLFGAETAAAALREFARGRSDFVVQVTTPVGGQGLFPDMKPVGTMAALWAYDDAQQYARRFRMVDVATDVPLTVTVALAPGLEWGGGSAAQVAIVPDGWTGTVTVHRADPNARKAAFEQLITTEVSRDAASAVRRIGSGSVSTLARSRAEEVQLNPQPLPPVEISAVRHSGITAIGGHGSLISRGIGGSEVIHAERSPVDIAALVPRDDPAAIGVVTDIDFTIQEYVAPVIR